MCCTKAATIAELLAAVGGPANAEPLPALLVSRAGELISDEIENLRLYLASLQKELASRSRRS
jgi:hypothetical protein